MSEARLAPGIEVSALLARATAQGGFGAVLARGDADRGTILLVLLERGGSPMLLQRVPCVDGRHDWQSRRVADSAALDQQIAQFRRTDPDIWIVELDIPSTERFTAEMT